MINCFVLLQIKAWIKIELYYYVHSYFLCLLLFSHSSSNNINLKFNGCGIKFSSCMKVPHMVVVLKLKRMFTMIFSLFFCIFCILMFQILFGEKYLCIFFRSQCFQVQLALLEAYFVNVRVEASNKLMKGQLITFWKILHVYHIHPNMHISFICNLIFCNIIIISKLLHESMLWLYQILFFLHINLWCWCHVISTYIRL